MTDPLKSMTQDFVKTQAKLTTMSTRKQQLALQAAATDKALVEIEKTTDEKVYKVIGNILFHKDINDVKAELLEKKDFLSNQIKSLETEWNTSMEDFKQMSYELERARRQNGPDRMNRPMQMDKVEPDTVDLNSLMSGRYNKRY